MQNKKKALISVSDKSGLIELAKCLATANWEILSTGGTAKYLRNNGINITDVANVTDFPEILGGRVKTLHPKIHGGILAIRDNPEHQAQMQEHHIEGIDLLVVNLYPFVETIKNENVTLAEAIENIDIGGPAMIRAGAKNNKFVAVLVNPNSYSEIINLIKSDSFPDQQKRLELAALAYRHTSDYDNAINNYLENVINKKDNSPNTSANQTIPQKININLTNIQEMRYGENSHQSASLFISENNHDGKSYGLGSAKIIQGKAMSYNNFADANAALQCVLEFSEPACVIVKHANPCGVALAKDGTSAYKLAFACDPVSAFGGILAFNTKVEEATAIAIGEQFAEVIIAPAYCEKALAVFAKKTNLRLLQIPDFANLKNIKTIELRSILGGVLVQTPDKIITEAELKVVTKKTPSVKDLEELIFAFTVAKHVKSNAIIFSANNQTLGIGAGQMSRVDSTRIAVFKAKDRGFNLSGAFAASDAFFPFRDGLDEIAKAGAKAVIQPGGSMRDAEVIAAADEHGLIMVFSGVRHFRH